MVLSKKIAWQKELMLVKRQYISRTTIAAFLVILVAIALAAIIVVVNCLRHPSVLTVIKYGKATIAQILLKLDADVIETDKFGSTPLMDAAGRSNVEAVKILLDNGADVNKKIKQGQTALLYAVHPSSTNSIEILNMLLDKGAEINIIDNEEQTPLKKAIEFNRKDILDTLIARGANFHLKSKRGGTALMKAAAYGNSEMRSISVSLRSMRPLTSVGTLLNS
jgi:uncharacterized protein